MKTYKCDVAIVGGGLAGLTAAERLADKGLHILVLDDSDQLGGQILRRPPENMVIPVVTGNEGLKKNGARLIEQIRKGKTEVKSNTAVLGVFPGPELLVEEDQGGLIVINPRTVLFATGARERFLPFKGWTLPGVISTGALQLLIKKSGMLPAEKVMIGATGLFPLAVAYNVIANGGRVQAVVDRNGMLAKAAVITQLPAQLDKIIEGQKYLARILLSRTPILHNTKIVEACGTNRLEQVITARIDKQGRSIPGSEKVHPVELLAVGYGFAPNIELPQLAGCALEYDMLKGGWAIKVNDGLETSVENIFAAGETTGVAGALKSMTEGRLAALSILERLGIGSPAHIGGEKERLKKTRNRHLTFGAFFNSLCRPPQSDLLELPEEEIICRCEDVRVKDVKKAFENGASSPKGVKMATRSGMGRCQGRTCGPIIYEMASAYQGPDGHLSPLKVRTPTKPVKLAHLADLADGIE